MYQLISVFVSLPGELAFYCQDGTGWRRKFKFGRLSCLLPPGSLVSDLTGLFLAFSVFSVQGHSLNLCERVFVVQSLVCVVCVAAVRAVSVLHCSGGADKINQTGRHD